MHKFETALEWLCDNIIWGTPMMVLILGSGVYLSFKIKFFQIIHLKFIINNTVMSLFKKQNKKSKDGSVSQLQVISTTLAATIGTGNIAGVATALTFGGAGAVFWMWVSAFLGMATAYAENLLAVYYRKRTPKGRFLGGAMYYLRDGLSGQKKFKKSAKPLAFLFAVFCVFASFGMGNMIQVNTVSEVLSLGIFGVKLTPFLTGIAIALFISYAIFGGTERICRITERLVPVMAFFYILGTFLIVIFNFNSMGKVVFSIFKGAFSGGAVFGGISGYTVKNAIKTGLRRGIFSNEAGLGSSTLVGAYSQVNEPAVQGMWGIFTVFFDTVIGCSLTAFAILSSGVDYTSKSHTGAVLVYDAFAKNFGANAGELVSVFTMLFALSTVIGWSFYGMKAAEYLLGEKSVWIYKLLFSLSVVPGAMLELNTVWLIADIFNGFMAIPNLIGVLALSGQIKLVSDNYKKRYLNNKSYTPPILSVYD